MESTRGFYMDGRIYGRSVYRSVQQEMDSNNGFHMTFHIDYSSIWIPYGFATGCNMDSIMDPKLEAYIIHMESTNGFHIMCYLGCGYAAQRFTISPITASVHGSQVSDAPRELTQFLPRWRSDRDLAKDATEKKSKRDERQVSRRNRRARVYAQ